MGHPHYTTHDIATRGREIYEQQLRGKLEPENKGRFLVIDIETGDYEIDDDDLTASLRAYHKRPEGARYGMRIGFSSSGTLGASLTAAAK